MNVSKIVTIPMDHTHVAANKVSYWTTKKTVLVRQLTIDIRVYM